MRDIDLKPAPIDVLKQPEDMIQADPACSPSSTDSEPFRTRQKPTLSKQLESGQRPHRETDDVRGQPRHYLFRCRVGRLAVLLGRKKPA